MFIDLNYISLSLSLLCTLHILDLTLSWVVFIALPLLRLLLFLLYLCVIISFLCSEILGCYYKSLNKQTHRKSCHLCGKGLTLFRATRKGVIHRKQRNQHHQQKFILSAQSSVTLKYFPSSSPKGRTFKSIRLSQHCYLSTFPL